MFCHLISIFVHSTLNPLKGPVCCLCENVFAKMPLKQPHGVDNNDRDLVFLLIFDARMHFRVNSHMLKLLLWRLLLLVLIGFNPVECWASKILSKVTPDWVTLG